MNESDTDEILATVSSDDLIGLVKEDARFSRENLGTSTVDQLGNSLLPKSIDGENVQYAFWPKYWTQLKIEFKKLLCSRDKKYERLRQELAREGDKQGKKIVYSIAGAMAAVFGVTAGVLVPFCAMILIAVLKLGREAYCKCTDLDIVIEA